MKKTLVIVLLLLSTLAFGFFEDIVETFESAPLISAEPIYAYVVADALNLRDAPSTEGEKIGLLHQGDMVELIRWAVDYEMYSDDKYLWAEVVSEGQRGYLAAVRLDSYYDETGVTIPDTTYLRFQHDFGQEELSAGFDLDGDGSTETITARLGELKLGMVDNMYGRNYRYFLPVELVINGSRRLTHRLGEIDIARLTEPTASEELSSDDDRGWCTFYEFDFADVNSDGRVDIGLNYSHFPACRSWGRADPDQRVWQWFSLEDDGLRSILFYTDYLDVSFYYGDGGNYHYWGWQWDNRFTFTTDGAKLLLTVTMPFDLDLASFEDCSNLPLLTTTKELSTWNTVTHTLTPPNYLDDCRSYTSTMRLKLLDEAGCYVLDCPADNLYGAEYYFSDVIKYPLDLAGGPIPLEDEWRYEWQTEEVYRSFELYNHPGGEAIYEVPVGSYMRYQAYELDGQVWSIGITEDDMTGWLLGRPSDES